jgi:aryl-alcohol dehydrogenase-like predicted oxidoreductase
MSEQRVSRRKFVQGTATVAAGAALGASVAAAAPDPRKTRSYNENMEYRRLGRTDLMLSVVSMGGHWKRIPYERGSDEFKKNRRDVMNACLEHGINFIDACSTGEVMVYSEALKGRREEIYFGFDWGGARKPEVAGSVERLKQALDEGLKQSGLDYVDIWRITLREHTTRNTVQEIENVMAAFEWGKKTGRARFTGVSTHHRPWIAEAIAKYPQLEVIITPYAAGSKEKPVGSMFDAIEKYDAGFIGIKPFASGTVFASRGVPDSPTKEEDDERARTALRYVFCCDVLAAAIPGLITVDQVKNAAAAVKERHQLDLAETRRFEKITASMWRNLPPNYKWLRDWEWV